MMESAGHVEQGFRHKENEIQQTQKTSNDIIDETIVGREVGKVETHIKESPLSEPYKSGLTVHLQKMVDQNDQELQAIKQDEEQKLVQLHEASTAEFADFQNNPEVAEIISLIEPIFAHKSEIIPIIDLETYKNGSGFWQEINAKLAKIGITQPQIVALQTHLKIKADGQTGPETMNALGRLLGADIDVKMAKETKYRDRGEQEETTAKPTGKPPAEQPSEALSLDEAQKIVADIKKIQIEQQAAMALPEFLALKNNLIAKSVEADQTTKGPYENYLKTRIALAEEIQGMHEMRDRFIKNDPIRAEALYHLIGSTLDIPLTEIDEPQGPPTTTIVHFNGPTAEFAEYTKTLKQELILEQHEIYLRTLDPQYRPAFDHVQDKVTAIRKNEMEQPNVPQEKEIIDKLDAAARNKVDDPNKAIIQGQEIQELIDKNPELKKYEQINLAQTMDTLTNNPHSVKFAESVAIMADPNHHITGYVLSVQKMLGDIEGGMDEPTSYMMDRIHEGARETLADPLLQKITTMPGYGFIKALKKVPGDSPFAISVNKIIEEQQESLAQIEKYIASVQTTLKVIQEIDGSDYGVQAIVKDCALIALNVGGGLAAGLLFKSLQLGVRLASLGNAAGRTMAKVAEVGFKAVGSTLTTSGGKAVIEQDLDNLNPQILLQQTAYSAITGGIAKAGTPVLAKHLGNAYSKAISSPRLGTLGTRLQTDLQAFKIQAPTSVSAKLVDAFDNDAIEKNTSEIRSDVESVLSE